MPVDALLGIACYDDAVAADLNALLTERKLAVKVAAYPAWYFR